MKVKIGIFKCTGIMGQDLVHPYIPSTTVLCDNSFVHAQNYIVSCHRINSVCIAVFLSLCNTLSHVKSVGSEFLAAAFIVCRDGRYGSSRVWLLALHMHK